MTQITMDADTLKSVVSDAVAQGVARALAARSDDRYIDYREIMELTGYKKDAVYKIMNSQGAPKPIVATGSTHKKWLKSEVMAYTKKRRLP